jgi:Domain of Unknown Function (DUF350)
MILQSLAGLPGFLAYFCTAFAITICYLFVYTRITPHDEFELIRKNVPGAAIALGLSLSDEARVATRTVATRWEGLPDRSTISEVGPLCLRSLPNGRAVEPTRRANKRHRRPLLRIAAIGVVLLGLGT